MDKLDILLSSGWLAQTVFAIFSIGSIGGAAYLLFAKNILYGAYGFLVSLISVAGLFFLLGAEFIGVSQIMIYVGGVLVLIMFGIMLSANGKNALEVSNVNLLLSLLIALFVSAGLIFMVSKMNVAYEEQAYEGVNQINGLGMDLMTTHVSLLEIIGVLLLVVLIGASFITKKRFEDA
jgi:NADH-quinone oxidoreductase subunit J